jgi:phosphohistidine swiveling domain-containing protein
MSIQNRKQHRSEPHEGSVAMVLPFAAIDHTSIPIVGGKAANLGELTRAGLPVPPGFCVTTAAYALVAVGADLEAILGELATTRALDTAHLAALASTARAHLLAAPMPAAVAEAIAGAYQALGGGEPLAVAVRSSATAEDLPFASFAGQQDTYLNIIGLEAVLDAVRRGFASLWTDRAVSYRASKRIDQRTVRLAVVVQRMVEASVAGVLFTANPLTGRRHEAVIDASPGLGEAIVSGAVNPDHFVVTPATGEITERRLGDKRLVIQSTPGGGTQRIETAERSNEACLTDAQVRALAELGARVEAHYGAPQDTEWAIDASGHLWLTQARPITTLYPLPADAPETDNVLRVYFSFSVAQGVYQPITPMGLQGFRLMSSSIATFIGFPPQNPLAGAPLLKLPGQRLYVDVTPLLRNALGRNLAGRVLGVMEARAASIFRQLADDPRLSLVPTPHRRLFSRAFSLMVRARTPFYMLQALFRPAATRRRITRVEEQLSKVGTMPTNASSSERLTRIEGLLLSRTAPILSSLVPIIITGVLANTLAGKLLNGLATDDERQTVLRSLPYNPTTEMDLALWHLAQRIRIDPGTAQVFHDTPLERLAQGYHDGALPPTLQRGLAGFLQTYGHRGIAEIDLGLPRWREDPTHLLGVLANYLERTNPELAADVQFQRGAEAAEAMVVELTRRAARKGWLRGKLVGFFLRRVRALVGLREVPKFCFMILFGQIRELLWPVGHELAEAGRLERAEDIFFITLSEAREALAGTDLRPVVRERHASYEQELKRRHIPRVLLSDGTEPTAEGHTAGSADGALKGTPASAGRVTAKARVILDPIGARLSPGEILVAPSTDPGWTPLFLTASGLVMEMGGAMSHGAVVAREYGIPAVVGVPEATERISTGQRITVDGSAGTIVLEEERS